MNIAKRFIGLTNMRLRHQNLVKVNLTSVCNEKTWSFIYNYLFNEWIWNDFIHRKTYNIMKYKLINWAVVEKKSNNRNMLKDLIFQPKLKFDKNLSKRIEMKKVFHYKVWNYFRTFPLKLFSFLKKTLNIYAMSYLGCKRL